MTDTSRREIIGGGIAATAVGAVALASTAQAQQAPPGMVFESLSMDKTLEWHDANKYFVCATLTPSPLNVLLPDPFDLADNDLIAFKKADNDSGPVYIDRLDGLPIDGWEQLILQMHGDWIVLGIHQGDYVIHSHGTMPVYGGYGQHRVFRPFSASHPTNWYNVRRWDRGALIKCSGIDNNGNMGVWLPDLDVIGFFPGGYRATWRVAVMTINMHPESGQACMIRASGNRSINGRDHIILREDYEKVWLDFDSFEWTIDSYFKPSDNPWY